MTITLKPYSEGLRGAASDLWDDFKICSWDAKRGWLQHCHGLVGVRNSPAANAVDAQLPVRAGRGFGCHDTQRTQKAAMTPRGHRRLP